MSTIKMLLFEMMEQEHEIAKKRAELFDEDQEDKLTVSEEDKEFVRRTDWRNYV